MKKTAIYLSFTLFLCSSLNAQVVTSSMTDSLVVDSNSNNQVNPGDVIRYKTTINVAGAKAGNVNYTLPLPSYTSGIVGSIKSSALARLDSFAVPFAGSLSDNVLTNDFGLPSLAVTSFGTVALPNANTPGSAGLSNGGGNLTIQANGNFTYSPAANFTGFDFARYNVSTGFYNSDFGDLKMRVGEPAMGVNDSYNVLGNVSITVPNPGFLANDSGDAIEAKTINGSAANFGVGITTANGGTLIAFSDGFFTYIPPPGFQGTDYFTYTVDNGFNTPSTATVNLVVSGMIWFINNNAPGGGNGRLTTPFNSIAAFNSAASDGVNDNIFLYESSTTYSGAINLLNGQKVIGQDATASLLAITGYTLPPHSASLPATNSGNGTFVNLNSTINLGSGNTLRGFNVITNGSVNGNNFGTCNISDFSMNVANTALDLTTGTLNATINNLTSTAGDTLVELNSIAGSTSIAGGNLTNATQKSVFISGGSLNFTYSGGINHTGASTMVEVKDHTTGAITFQSGNLTATAGTGLLFNNADGTYLFNGTTTLNGGDAGIDILNGCSGSFTFANAPITNPSGPCININSCTPGTITHSGTLSKNNTGRLIDISSNASGTITFNGNLSSTATSSGILVNANSGVNITFAGVSKILNTGASTPVSIISNSGTNTTFSNGGLDIDVTSATGFNASAGGTVSVLGSGNTINAVSGTSLSVVSSTIGVSGLNFQSISSGSASNNGIILDNTGTNGGLTVSGDNINTTQGGNASGGTITGKTGSDGSLTSGIGIYLNNTAFVTLRRMSLSNFENLGVFGTSVNGFTMEYCTISGTIGTSTASNDAAIAFGKTNPSGTNGLNGANPSLINQCIIRDAIEHNMEFYNQSGSFNLTISNCQVRNNTIAGGGDGIQIEMQGTATSTISVQNCFFDDNKSQPVQAAANDNSTLDMTINNCNVQKTVQGNEGFVLSNGSNGNLTAHVTNNTITGIGGVAIFVGQTAGNASALSRLTAVVKGNNITHPVSATNSAIIALLSSTVGQVSISNLLVENNTVIQNSTSGISRGILIDTPDSGTSPSFTARVVGNNVSVMDNVAGVNGIAVQARQSATACSDIRNNTVTYPNGVPAGVFGLRLRQANTGNVYLEQGISAGTPPIVIAVNNPASTTEIIGTVTVVGNNTCQSAPN